jgi:xanthine dehydrogenase accessory factor
MLSSQQHIISHVSDWLNDQKPVWLCTILKTWGSSPRPVGAMMACTLEGELVGSISGGCIEEDFLEQLRDGGLKSRFDEEQKPFVVKYGVTAEEQARLKLPCGGQLHVLLEHIDASKLNIDVFSRLKLDLEQHKSVSRIVDLTNGEITANESSSDEAVVFDASQVTHSLSPMYRLLLLGAGDVARYVAEMALALEYDVVLCDPRPNYLDNWHVEGVETISRLPDDVVRESYNNPYSGIIALAHDPRVDDMALMEALKTEAFYIGAMGSERTSAARRERLPELGLSESEIARLHAPIGLQISSKTPAEIAISVMAEVTAVRHHG